MIGYIPLALFYALVVVYDIGLVVKHRKFLDWILWVGLVPVAAIINLPCWAAAAYIYHWILVPPEALAGMGWSRYFSIGIISLLFALVPIPITRDVLVPHWKKDYEQRQKNRVTVR